MRKNLKYLQKIQKLKDEIEKEKQKLIFAFEKAIEEYDLFEILTIDTIKNIAEQISDKRDDKEIYIILKDEKEYKKQNKNKIKTIETDDSIDDNLKSINNIMENVERDDIYDRD